MAESLESGVGLPADGTGKTVDTLGMPYYRQSDGTFQQKEIQSVVIKNEQGELVQLSEVQGLLGRIADSLDKIAFLLEVRA